MPSPQSPVAAIRLSQASLSPASESEIGGAFRHIVFNKYQYDSLTEVRGDGATYFTPDTLTWTSCAILQPGVYAVNCALSWADDFNEVHAVQIDMGWYVCDFELNGTTVVPSVPFTPPGYSQQMCSFVDRYPIDDNYPSHTGWPSGSPGYMNGVSIGVGAGSDKFLLDTSSYIDIIMLDKY